MDFLTKRAAALAGAAQPPTTKQKGDAAEDAALRHLQAAGLRLLERNYRTPGRGGGEIDLILRALDGTLVFVEVRQRTSSLARRRSGQCQRHQATAHHLCRTPLPDAPARAAAVPLRRGGGGTCRGAMAQGGI